MRLEISDDFFNEEELKNTPNRFKRFIGEWLESEDFNFTVFDSKVDEMVIVKGITFYSLCSHHLLPFFGKAAVGYIPNGKVCGLSKIVRTIDKFSHKPQMQENLTQEIAEFLITKLNPKGVIVILEAEHLCMSMRGIKRPGTSTITSAVRGCFLKPDELGKTPKEEFLRLLKNGY